jgi:hypothetical protein
VTEQCGKPCISYSNRTAISDYSDQQFEGTVFTFLNGAEDCETFMVEWKESCVNKLKSADVIWKLEPALYFWGQNASKML